MYYQKVQNNKRGHSANIKSSDRIIVTLLTVAPPSRPRPSTHATTDAAHIVWGQAYPSKHKTFCRPITFIQCWKRRRRWAAVVQMLYKCFVFAGMCLKIESITFYVLISGVSSLIVLDSVISLLSIHCLDPIVLSLGVYTWYIYFMWTNSVHLNR